MRLINENLKQKLERFASLPAVHALVVFVLLAAPLAGFYDADPDLFARLAVGKLFVVSGGMPLQDPFAFTPKNPVWYDHEWLTGVVFYHLSQWGSDPLLFVFKFVTWFVAILLLARAQAVMGGCAVVRFWWLLLTALWCGYIWIYTVRSQVFTYLLFAWLLLAFARVLSRQSLKPLYPAPLIMAAWANLHGGFVAGLGCLFVFCTGLVLRRRGLLREALVILAASGAATLINPYGYRYLLFISHAVTMDRPGIEEWRSLSLDSALGMGLLVYGAILFVAWLNDRRSFSLPAILLLVVTNLYGWEHGRLLALFMMTAAVFGVVAVDALLERTGRLGRRYLLPGAAVAALCLAVVSFPKGLLSFAHAAYERPQFTLHYHNYPVSALEWLARNRQGGRLLVEYKYGSYALWRLFPKFLVSMDGRYEEVYPQRTVDLVRAAFDPSKPLHGEALRELDFDYIVGDVERQQVYDFGTGWSLLYKDERNVLYGRSPNPDGAVSGEADGVVPDLRRGFELSGRGSTRYSPGLPSNL